MYQPRPPPHWTPWEPHISLYYTSHKQTNSYGKVERRYFVARKACWRCHFMLHFEANAELSFTLKAVVQQHSIHSTPPPESLYCIGSAKVLNTKTS